MPTTLPCVWMQDAPVTEVMVACEASEQKLTSLNIAKLLQLTDQQLDTIVQLRSDFLERHALAYTKS